MAEQGFSKQYMDVGVSLKRCYKNSKWFLIIILKHEKKNKIPEKGDIWAIRIWLSQRTHFISFLYSMGLKNLLDVCITKQLFIKIKITTWQQLLQ